MLQQNTWQRAPHRYTKDITDPVRMLTRCAWLCQARVLQLETALEKKDFEAEALRSKLLGTAGTKAGAGGVASPAPTPPSGSSRSRKVRKPSSLLI